MTVIKKIDWIQMIGKILNYLGIVVLIFIIFFIVFNGRKYYFLNQNNVKITGTISKIFCERHQGFEYKFQVNNKLFSENGNSHGVEHPCEALKIGDQVDVFYYPDDPSINIVNEDPHEGFEGGLFSMLLMSFIFSGAILFFRLPT
jgi:hypothetical protein